MMYYFQELSVKEIASACSCSENTVKSRLNYARKNLEKKATALKKKGILMAAFTLSILPMLLRDDFASAAVGDLSNKVFSAIWEVISTGVSDDVSGVAMSASVVGGSAVKGGVAHVFSAKMIVAIVCSVTLGAGTTIGLLFGGGFFSDGKGGSEGISPANIESTHTPGIIPELTDAPEPSSSVESVPELTSYIESTPKLTPEQEKTPKPEKTKKPKPTPKPTEKPKKTSKPSEEPVDWDGNFIDWDDDFTDWDD